MALNGILAGLVGITAGADSVSVWSSVNIGFIAGVIVVVSVIVLDKIKIDDPVGAISVHGVCGVWGTVAVGLFGTASLVSQIIGAFAFGAVAFIASFAIAYSLKLSGLWRVDEEDERIGLDISEHGQEAYPEFK